MTTIYTVYYTDFMGMTPKQLRDAHGFSDLRIQEWFANRVTPQKSVAQLIAIEESKFKDTFLPKTKPNEYYLFIVTNSQLGQFTDDITSTDFLKYQVYRGPAAVNANYPSDGPKLHTFLFYTKG